MILSEKDLHTIAGALRVAADVYGVDAKKCAIHGQHRIANEFHRQKHECESLLDRVENRHG